MNVLIVDDHAIVRDGLALLIKDAFNVDVCLFASEGREAISIAEKHALHLILLDLSMPGGMDGMQTLLEMRRIQAKAKIVILSMHEEQVYQQKAYDYGADAYLIKRLKGEELIKKLDLVMMGKRLFLEIVKQSSRRKDVSIWDLPISAREKEVFTLTVLGHTQREIGEQLGISIKTVENHRYNISQKLGLTKRSDWLDLAKKYNVFDMH